MPFPAVAAHTLAQLAHVQAGDAVEIRGRCGGDVGEIKGSYWEI